MPRGFSWRRALLAAVAAALAGPAAVRAAPVDHEMFTVTVATGAAPFTVAAERIRGRMWIDFSRIAASLGASRRAADGGELWEFDGHQVFFWKDLSAFRVRSAGEKPWQTAKFEKSMFYDGKTAMVPLSALPALSRRTFSYHRQRRTLTVEPGDGEHPRGRRVPARHEPRDGHAWVSLEDTARALGVVTFNSQPNRFRLVMPDFTILELRTGDNTVFQRNAAHARLPDPVLLFGGSPFLTVRALKILFGADLAWDAAEESLVVPARFGRVADAGPAPHRLHYRGYEPQPATFRVEELSTFYQEPAAVYPADHPDIYESVRDLMTDEPIVSGGSREDRFNASAVLSLGGNTAGVPFGGRGAIEKVGGTSRVVNGSLRWGFPVLQVQGGREYLTFGGLTNQFNVVDGVNVSHSSDHYGDNDRDVTLGARAGYGRHDFSLYLSTATFSQTVRMRQSFVTAGLDGAWNGVAGGRLTARLSHFVFDNEPAGVDSSYFDEEILREIFGDDVETSVDPKDAASLTRTALNDRHDTTLLNVVYDTGRDAELTASLGVSRFDGPTGGVIDSDALVRLVAGGRRRRIDASFERSGADYRSIGDPSRYQDRKIFRLAPQIELARPWRVLGEFRREDNGALRRQGIAPYTNRYASVVNLLTFRPGTIRATLTDFDSSLYGNRRSSDVNLTKHVGRDSIEAGGGASAHRLSTGAVFRRSTTARAGYQHLRPGRRVSAGHEYTWHRYASGARRHETLTTFLAEIRPWRALAQYARSPKSFFSDDILHVGTVTVGRRLADARLLNVFYSGASERSNLSHPLAWRAGAELVTTFE